VVTYANAAVRVVAVGAGGDSFGLTPLVPGIFGGAALTAGEEDAMQEWDAVGLRWTPLDAHPAPSVR
jgi:hypothetical protein